MVFITTPIYYPSGRPHLGSAYTTLAADTLARLYRLLGHDVFFLTGMDEHGEKIQRKAEEEGLPPQEYVDRIAVLFKKAWERLHINYDFFIRTTHPKHKAIVRQLLQKAYEEGYIYKGVYEGYYCVSCERYYTEKDLVEGKCPYHYKPVEKRRIESYFFKLSQFQDRLLQLYQEKPRFLPPLHREEVINRVKEGLKDLSISRPKEQVSWGIEVPFDPNHVVYVWFDALLNYYTGPIIAGRPTWPPTLQLMGKDIIWFHTVIWPAMLMALHMELPEREIAHGFLTVDGRKMSKSLGNVIDPLEVAERYGSDALRYYLLVKLSFGGDGDFSWQAFRESYAKELAGDVGNLANRLVVLRGKVGLGRPTGELTSQWDAVERELREKAATYDVEGLFNESYGKLFSFVRAINAFLNEKEPWRSRDSDAVAEAWEAFEKAKPFLATILPEGMERFERALSEGGRAILYPKVEEKEGG